MAQCYSRNSSVVHVAFDFKKLLLARTLAIVGAPRSWQNRIPLQCLGDINYEFMNSPETGTGTPSLGFSGNEEALPKAKRP